MKRTRHKKQILTSEESGRLLLILSRKGHFYNNSQVAFKAIEALLEMFSRAELVQILSGSDSTTAQPVPDAPVHELVDKLAMLVDDLDIHRTVRVRVRNCLANYNIRCLYELVQMQAYGLDGLSKIKNFGRKSLQEVTDALARMGLTLGMQLDEATIIAVRAEIAQQRPAGK